MKFGYTIIYVESVAQTLAFYRAAFGFETRFLHESGQYGELATGNTVLAFASHDMGRMHLPGGYRRVDEVGLPLGQELAFVTDDVPHAYQTALTAGAVALAEPAVKSWGQTVAYVRSAEGSVVELCSPMGT